MMYAPKAELPDNRGECAHCGRVTEDGRDVELCEEDGIEARGQLVTGEAFLCDECDNERQDRFSRRDYEKAVELLEDVINDVGLHPILRARKTAEMVDKLRAEVEMLKTLADAGPRCECSPHDACAHVRRAMEAESELGRLKAAPVVVSELTLEWCDEIWRKCPMRGAPAEVVKWVVEQDRSRLRTVQPGEVEELRLLLGIALDHVEASAEAQHLLDGFRRQVRPLDALVDEIRAVLRARPTTNEKEA